MMAMRSLLTLCLALGLAVPAAAQTRPNRFVTVANESWGYVQSAGAAVTFPDIVADEGPGSGFRAGIIITILTRDGRPVTEADRNDAWFAARAACEGTRRRFDTRAQGIMLRRGGISYPGHCG